MASRGGTNDTIFGITVSTKFLIGVYNMGTVPILRLIPQYEEVKGVGVGVLQRNKRHNFWHLVKGVGVGVSRKDKHRFLALRQNLRHYSYSMCAVPILRLLPQY